MGTVTQAEEGADLAHRRRDGQLSYSKVRALVRMATPASEAELVGLADHATAAHLDRIARARRSVERIAEAELTERRHQSRHVHWFWDDDGSLVLTARLAPEEGAVVLQALDDATHALRTSPPLRRPTIPRDRRKPIRSIPAPLRSRRNTTTQATPADRPTTSPPHPPAMPSRSRWRRTRRPRRSRGIAGVGRRPARAANLAASGAAGGRADALVAMAESMLEHGPAARDGDERYQGVIVVDAEVLAGGGEGRFEVQDDPSIAPETSQRLTCDARILAVIGGREANCSTSAAAPVPSLGDPPGAPFRDGGCRFPGCTQRRNVDGHHAVHWAAGGPTSLDNLVLLCRFHHRTVHEGGFGLHRSLSTRPIRVHHSRRRPPSRRR